MTNKNTTGRTRNVAKDAKVKEVKKGLALGLKRVGEKRNALKELVKEVKGK